MGSANVPGVAVTCPAVTGSDDFNRADGGLGPNWTAISDGAMSISSQAVIGTAGAQTGDIRTAGSYPSDQFSAGTVTSTQLTGGQGIGAAGGGWCGGAGGLRGLFF